MEQKTDEYITVAEAMEIFNLGRISIYGCMRKGYLTRGYRLKGMQKVSVVLLDEKFKKFKNAQVKKP